MRKGSDGTPKIGDGMLRKMIRRQSRTQRAEKKSSGRHAEMEQAESKHTDGALDHENAEA
jgi:hypothetical protein